MDLRNYYPTIKKSEATNSNSSSVKPSVTKKRVIVDDEDEDVIPESPAPAHNGKRKKKKNRISDSESDSEIFTSKPAKHATSSKKKSPTKQTSNMKEVNANDIFGSKPVQRTPVIKVKTTTKVLNEKKESITEIGIHSDEEFDKTLIELDEESLEKSFKAKKTETIPSRSPEKSNVKSRTPKRNSTPVKAETVVLPRKSPRSRSSQKEVKLEQSPVKKPPKLDIDKGRSPVKINDRSSSKSPQKTFDDEIKKQSNVHKSHRSNSRTKKDEKSRKDEEKKRDRHRSSKSKSPRKDAKHDGNKLDKKRNVDKIDSPIKIDDDSSGDKDQSSVFKSKRQESPSKRKRKNDTEPAAHISKKSKSDDKKKSPRNRSPKNSKTDDKKKSPRNRSPKDSKSDDKKESLRSRSPKKPDSQKSPSKPSRLPQIKKMSDKINTSGKDFSVFINDTVSSESPATVKKEIDKESFLSPKKIADHLNMNVTPKSDSKGRKRKMSQTPELTDEERQERKRHSLILYNEYRNRAGPKNPGSKEIPEGKPNCLSGMSFLVTGVLDSIEKEEVADIVKKYSGVMKQGVSKKLTHLICGEGAGPAKLADAERLGIPVITEDEFLDLLRGHPAEKPQSSPVKTEKLTPRKRTSSTKTPSKKNKVQPLFGSQGLENGESGKRAVKKEIEHEDVSSKYDDVSAQEAASVAINKDSIDSKQKDLSLAWVDKYKPNQLKQIIGQQGDASNAKKLCTWLSNWYLNRKRDIPKPSPWSKGDGSYYKAALLSGPPGVGKTTTVSLVCKELGFDTVEFNASDTRSKSLIKEQISDLVSTKSLSGYVHGKAGKGAVTKKHVVIMDEVDGMAGNEDRGGMQELIALIKQSSVPIICMCNDKTTMKMRSLVNSCYDLTYSRPKVEQIKGAMMSICFKEGISISPANMHQLITGANQDIRQILNLLSMWSAADKTMTTDSVAKDSKMAKKDMKMGPWSVLRMVFSEEEHKTMSIHDKSDLFFHDYSMSPLFVQQNYLKVSPHCPKNEVLKRFAEAADCLSIGDIVEAKIRGSMAWSLLPVQAMYSSVLPGAALSGHVQGQIDFPAWLGQNSRTNKMHRLAQELHSHTGLSTSGSKLAMRLDYASHLRDAILTPLVKHRAEGIPEALSNLQAYHLLREDLDSLLDITSWPGKRDQWMMVDPKIKTALTKAYNKEAAPLPYSQMSLKKGRSAASTDTELELSPLDEGTSQEVEDLPDSDSDLESDTMIKKSKKPAAATKKPNVASSSKDVKKKGQGKGKSK